MNFGTKLRTILAIATSLNTALMATDLTGFNNGVIDLVYKIVSIVRIMYGGRDIERQLTENQIKKDF